MSAAEGIARRRHVWIVNHHADAPDRPAGTRHFDLARRLVADGQDVTIFAAGFSNVTQREERLAGRRLYRRQRFDGVDFVWLRTVPYRGNTWRRVANMVSFAPVFLVVQSRFRQPDVVVGSTVHPLAPLAAWACSRLRGAVFVYEIRDLWPQTLIDLGAIGPRSLGARALRTIEAFSVRRAEAVITLLPGVGDYLRERRLPAAHVAYVPNGVDLVAFDAARSATVASPELAAAIGEVERLRSEGRFVIGYVGSFGRVNHAEVLLTAAALAERRAPGKIGLILVGDGPEREALAARALEMPNVAFGGAVPRRAVPQLLGTFDACAVHANATPVYRYGVSFNKLFEYMAAGKPIVFGCTSSYDPVARSGCGISLPPDDSSQLADAFICLAGLAPDERARMGAAGRAYVEEHHSLELQARRLALVLERAQSGRREIV